MNFKLDANLESLKGSLETDLEKAMFNEMSKNNIALKRMSESLK